MSVRPVTRLAARRLAALLLTLPATACGAGWKAVPTPWPDSFPARQQVQVYAGSGMVRLHGVRITPDSLSGIPFLQPLTCDSCRIGYARAQVDSVRTGDPAQGLWATTGLVLGLVLAGLFALCFSGAGCPDWISGST